MNHVVQIITIALFGIGLVGCFLPIIPGNVVVWLGVLFHKLALGDESVSWGFFVVATVLTLAALVLDLVCSYWGARRFGASWQGAVGAVVGAVLGMVLLGIPGVVIGPIAGAIAVELVKSWSWRRAGRAGVGTIVGGIAAFVLKLAFAAIVIAGFFGALP